MSNGNRISIRRVAQTASEAEIARIVDLILVAFDKDVYSSFMVGGHDGYIKQPSVMPDLNRAILNSCLIDGEVYVAEFSDSDAGIVGAAMWHGPGQVFMAKEEQRQAGWNEYMKRLYELNPEMRSWWEDYCSPLYEANTKDAIPEPGTPTDAWKLVCIGTSPLHHRKGIGRALIEDCERSALSRPDAKPENLWITLETETPEGLSFYKKLGFEVKSEWTLKGPPGVGGTVPMWSLTKKIQPC